MIESMKGFKRTHKCGKLGLKNIDETVILTGWVHRRRDLGGVIFVDLRDRSGVCQIVFDKNVSEEAFEKGDRLRSEYVIGVKGKVKKRPDENVNPKIPTGEIEVFVEEVRIFSRAETPPFAVEDRINVDESIRLKYRYIDLRRPLMQKNIIIRSKATQAFRNFLNSRGFLEIETPMLTKSTPEGARDYLVPSRVNPGKFYALPQSPQLFKQILMISGFEKYYQIARCFRDEDLRSNRQPEFTQVDIEMSFVDVDDVLKLNEEMVKYVFEEIKGIKVDIPFPRITYQDAVEQYGTDKPDTRFGMKLVDITQIVKNSEFKVFRNTVEKGGNVKGINVKSPGFSRREIDGLIDLVKEYGGKGLAWIMVEQNDVKSPISKFLSQQEIDQILQKMDAQPKDLLLFVADNRETVNTVLGNLRLELGRRLNLIDNKKFNFLWITDFPLLEYDEEEKRYVAMHHPFTSPKDEDIQILDTHPEQVRAKAYDLVLNGVELGGGSIRIHSTELQEKMLSLLGFSKEEAWNRFGFLLKAFKYGTPPHGGIAYGLDRIVMFLAETENIRDVIAFPKTQNAVDLMTEAPSEVDPKQLEELHIEVTL